MYLKQRLLQGGALRSSDHLLVCGADGDENNGGGGDNNADEAVKKLSAKLDEVLGEKKKLAEKVRGFEATEAERKAKEVEAEEAAARQKGDFEKIENGYKTKVSTLEGESYLWKSRYEGLVIDRGMDEALDSVKVSPALKKAALALIKSEHPPELDSEGRATIDGKPIADFVAAWAKSDTGKAFVVNGNSGGGAGGGSGGVGAGSDGNPWNPKTRNLTEQGRLFNADPAKARQMAAEHGVRL